MEKHKKLYQYYKINNVYRDIFSLNLYNVILKAEIQARSSGSPVIPALLEAGAGRSPEVRSS